MTLTSRARVALGLAVGLAARRQRQRRLRHDRRDQLSLVPRRPMLRISTLSFKYRIPATNYRGIPVVMAGPAPRAGGRPPPRPRSARRGSVGGHPAATASERLPCVLRTRCCIHAQLALAPGGHWAWVQRRELPLRHLCARPPYVSSLRGSFVSLGACHSTAISKPRSMNKGSGAL
jgi:hypothetical protein